MKSIERTVREEIGIPHLRYNGVLHSHSKPRLTLDCLSHPCMLQSTRKRVAGPRAGNKPIEELIENSSLCTLVRRIDIIYVLPLYIDYSLASKLSVLLSIKPARTRLVMGLESFNYDSNVVQVIYCQQA